jgi:hypothetical protein
MSEGPLGGNEAVNRVLKCANHRKRASCTGALTRTRNDHRSRRQPCAEAEDADRVLTKRDIIRPNALP